MKKIYTWITAVALLMSGVASAQSRFLNEVFDDVTVTSNITYGVNATVLYYSQLSEAVPEALKMDVYTPTGDCDPNRPLIIYLHTGNFLPYPQNGGIGGMRTDSSAVEICKRFARMGYVVASCDYRLGWNPVASTQQERVYTLINAAYRGVQDCRTAVRYFRRSVAEMGNPYGIDPSKVIVWGQGTGGYISLANATLDSYLDIASLPKFTQQVEIQPGVFIPLPMVMEEVNGNVDGTTVGINPQNGDTLCYINHPGYPSDVNLTLNMGGALGDSSWFDAGDGPFISFHTPTDPFAPYADGTVIVPGFNLPVVDVSGSYRVQEMAYQYGNNDVFYPAEVSGINVPFTNGANMHNGGFFGLYPLVRPATQPYDSAPWEWWDSASNINDANGLATNPDMSATKARTFIDTIQNYAAERIMMAINVTGGSTALLGDQCDDGDANTINDVIIAGCACAGVIANPGCMDITACNYNELANITDGSCFFVGSPCDDNNPNTPEDLIDANCLCNGIEVVIAGCTTPAACNYNPAANQDDGTCILVGDPCDDNDPNTVFDQISVNCNCVGQPMIMGCMDQAACNFNPLANMEDVCFFIGDACDDGDSNTVNDVFNANCVCAGTIGVEEVTSAHQVVLFPNPTEGNVTVTVKGAQSGKTVINVYNGLGQRVARESVNIQGNSSTFNLNLSSLSAGMYWVEMLGNGWTEHQRVSVK
jgi:hypothetical protein